MINLINNIYIDYQFGIHSDDNGNIILIDGLGKHPSDNANLECFKNLPEAMCGMTYSDWIRSLAVTNTKTVIKVLPRDMTIILVSHIKSIFPNISFQALKDILWMYFINNKYVMSNSHCNGVVVDAYNHLRFPSDTSIKKIFKTIQDPFTEAEKHFISSEFLLADYLNNKKSNYSDTLLSRVEYFILKNILWDFIDIRRDLLHGIMSLSDIVGIELDIFNENAITTLGDIKSNIIFKEISDKDTHFLKDNFKLIYEVMTRYNNSVGDIFGRTHIDYKIEDIFKNKGEFILDHHDLEEILEIDKKFIHSHIFGRCEFNHKINSLFIQSLYRNKFNYSELVL